MKYIKLQLFVLTMILAVVIPETAFGQRCVNYLPPGVDLSLSKLEYELFYDMYFDADFEWNNGIEYTFTGKNIPVIEPNDIIVHGDYETGFKLYLVNAKQNKNGKLKLEVREASVMEFVPSFSGNISMRKNDVLYTTERKLDGTVTKYTNDSRYFKKHEIEDPALIFINPDKGAVSGSQTFDIPLIDETNVMIYNSSISGYKDDDGVIRAYGANVEITAPEVKVIYTSTVYVGWETSWFDFLSAYVNLQGTFDAHSDIRVQVNAWGEYDYSKELLSTTKLFTVSGFPCTIRIDIMGIAHADAEGTGWVQAGAGLQFTHENGLSWTKTDGWKTTGEEPSVTPYMFNSSNTTGLPTYDFSADIYAELRIEPRVRLALADAVGASIIVAPSVRFQGNYETDFSWDINACVTGSGEMDLSIPIWGFVIAAHKEVFFEKCWLLYSSAGNKVFNRYNNNGNNILEESELNQIEIDYKTGTLSDDDCLSLIMYFADKGQASEVSYLSKLYSFSANYPNPFVSSTTINYVLNEPGHVILKIYNINGQPVTTLTDENKPAGQHSVKWNGTDGNGNKVNEGMYFYKIEAGKNSQINKMIMLK